MGYIYFKHPTINEGKKTLCQFFIRGNDIMVVFEGGQTLPMKREFLSEVDEWIDVKDVKPKTIVLAVDYQDEIIAGYICNSLNGYFECENESELLNEVTHWRPLPFTPKQLKEILNK